MKIFNKIPIKKLSALLLALVLVFSLTACGVSTSVNSQNEPEQIDEDGYYYSKDDVALYLYTYGHLPDNFIKKQDAEKLGWQGGSVEKFAPGMAIGGDKFGNYEGLLPEDAKYYECDIDTNGEKSRGAKRIIFSEGAEEIYYTEDHYEHFEQLY